MCTRRGRHTWQEAKTLSYVQNRVCIQNGVQKTSGFKIVYIYYCIFVDVLHMPTLGMCACRGRHTWQAVADINPARYMRDNTSRALSLPYFRFSGGYLSSQTSLIWVPLDCTFLLHRHSTTTRRLRSRVFVSYCKLNSFRHPWDKILRELYSYHASISSRGISVRQIAVVMHKLYLSSVRLHFFPSPTLHRHKKTALMFYVLYYKLNTSWHLYGDTFKV